MSRSIDNVKSRIALVLCHCAGVIDVVALPVWVGIVLIGVYGLEPQRAGALATCFLGAAVISSLIVSPRVTRLRGAFVVPAAFGVAAAAFFGLTTTRDYGAMMALHALGGLAVGCGLSIAHSAIGSSANPHRLIAIGFTVLSVLSLAFLGAVPKLVSLEGGEVLFVVLGSIMLVTALVAALGFPTRQPRSAPLASASKAPAAARTPLSRGVWLAMIGTILLSLNHSMMFSYTERVGVEHGFGQQAIMAVFLVIGIVNLFPGVAAALLERKVSAPFVMLAGPALHGILGFVLTRSTHFIPYAIAACVFPAVMIFTHTFIFAFLARQDPSTRAVAATPIMLMTGSALGPIVGGVVAQHFGYASIGWAVALIACGAVWCLWQAQGKTVPTAAVAEAAA